MQSTTAFIRRAEETRIANALPHQAVVITGPRRCGKSSLLRHLAASFEGEVRWFSGHSPSKVEALRYWTAGDADDSLILVIDEIQNVPDAGLLLKKLIDANPNTRILAAGSASLELPEGAATSRLWPFSLSELALWRSWGWVDENLGSFMVYGTHPFVVKDFDAAAERLTDYVEGVLFRDLFRMAEIRRGRKLSRLVSILARRIGSEIQFEGLGRELEVSKTTVERYIRLLERCFIVRVVPSWAGGLGNELKKGKKVYFTDVGVRNAVIGDFSPMSTRPDARALWENFFFMERVKRYDMLRDRREIYFWRTKGYKPKRVDLLEVRGREMEAFQCRLSPDAEIRAGKDFHAACPDCPVRVAAPANALRLLGLEA